MAKTAIFHICLLDCLMSHEVSFHEVVPVDMQNSI
jgi:hypothetical protein